MAGRPARDRRLQGLRAQPDGGGARGAAAGRRDGPHLHQGPRRQHRLLRPGHRAGQAPRPGHLPAAVRGPLRRPARRPRPRPRLPRALPGLARGAARPRIP